MSEDTVAIKKTKLTWIRSSCLDWAVPAAAAQSFQKYKGK